jgi:hypothetical protein
MSYRRVAIAGALLAGVLVVALSVSAVARITYDSHIKLYNSFPAFHGKVNSNGPEFCLSHRKVKMYKQRSGPDRFLGKDRTNDRGRWRVRFDPGSGAYYAKVKKRSSASIGITCRRDKSNTIVID